MRTKVVIIGGGPSGLLLSRLLSLDGIDNIVPPTGAKGLNLAVSDVYYLYNGLKKHYLLNIDNDLKLYSQIALSRIWKAIRFSWWMTTTFHKFPEQADFDQCIQDSELAYLENSIASQTVLAENYVGLPF